MRSPNFAGHGRVDQIDKLGNGSEGIVCQGETPSIHIAAMPDKGCQDRIQAPGFPARKPGYDWILWLAQPTKGSIVHGRRVIFISTVFTR